MNDTMNAWAMVFFVAAIVFILFLPLSIPYAIWATYQNKKEYEEFKKRQLDNSPPVNPIHIGGVKIKYHR